MKSAALVIIFLAAVHISIAEYQTSWLSGYSCKVGWIDCKAIAETSNGSIIAGGTFYGEIKNDAHTYRSTDNFRADMYIAKINQWTGETDTVYLITGPGNDYAYDMVVDKEDYIYICGFMTDTLYLREDLTLYSAGKEDIFFAKYNNEGECLWGYNFGSSGFDAAYAIAMDSSGYIYLTGHFEDTVAFTGDIVLRAYGSSDGFLAKFTPQGECLWAEQIAGNDIIRSKDISYDNGFLYVTGHFGTQAFFGSTKDLLSTGKSDIFLAQYGTDGYCNWVSQAGGKEADEGSSVASFGGTVALGGTFSEDAEFGNTFRLYSYGFTDGFAAKYTESGEIILVRQLGGVSKETVTDVVYGSKGAIYITGSFFENILFDDGTEFRTLNKWDSYVVEFNGFWNSAYKKHLRNSDIREDHVKSYCLKYSPTGDLLIAGNCISGLKIDYCRQFKVPTGYDNGAFFLSLSKEEESSVNFSKIQQSDFHFVRDAVWENDSTLILAKNIRGSAGAVWTKEKIDLTHGFETSFSIGGDSAFSADGIAFVIQNGSRAATGNAGCGLGYEGIGSSIAVEFDFYINDNKAKHNRHDPEENALGHIAVFSNGRAVNGSDHEEDNVLHSPTFLYRDSFDTNAIFTIKYLPELALLDIYFSESCYSERELMQRIFVRLDTLLGTENAFAGFTAATGDVYQTWKLLNWRFMVSKSLIPSRIAEQSQINGGGLEIYPNPGAENFRAEFFADAAGTGEIYVYTPEGRLICRESTEIYASGIQTVPIFLPEISAGLYFVIIRTGNNFYSGKLVILE